MHWDVVEVKPEPGYRLFVRFKDGLAGRVQLRQEELTGVLAPLLDAQFFEQVFIDCGAVAWPGEIDLAPDAMYAQVASEGQVHSEVFRSQLARFYELKDLSDPSNKDAYFENFEEHLQDETCFRTFVLWEENLQGLDAAAWVSLKSKACTYLNKNKKARGWQQFFNVLGEACGYNYLARYERCSAVRFIPESNDPTPDLEGLRDHERVLCEVKTINISDDEVRARRMPSVVRKLSDQLEEGFFRKIDSDIVCAKSQLDSYDPHGDAQHLVYINICFDDLFALYKEDYFQQIQRHLLEHPPGIKVVVSLDVSKTERQVVGQSGK
jgi:Protein of unknown function (DUF2442)